MACFTSQVTGELQGQHLARSESCLLIGAVQTTAEILDVHVLSEIEDETYEFTLTRVTVAVQRSDAYFMDEVKLAS